MAALRGVFRQPFGSPVAMGSSSQRADGSSGARERLYCASGPLKVLLEAKRLLSSIQGKQAGIYYKFL